MSDTASSAQSNTQKKPGRTYNMKLPIEAADPGGKKTWRHDGRIFIRDDDTGGAAFIGEGANQKVYSLFPASPRKGERPTPPAEGVAASAGQTGAAA